MSRVIDVPNKLAEYMIQGWVRVHDFLQQNTVSKAFFQLLTDVICQNANCNVPLMRPPSGSSSSALFCANCDVTGSSCKQTYSEQLPVAEEA